MTPDGSLQAISRRVLPAGADGESLERLGRVACDVLSTLEHNMSAPEGARLFEDSAVSVRFPAASLPLLRRWLERRGAPLLSDLEGWMTEREARENPEQRDAPIVRAGVAMVMFVDKDPANPAAVRPEG